MSDQFNTMNLPGRRDVLILLVMLLFVLAVAPVACRSLQYRASRSTCAENLALIGKAMRSYANDHEGAFPRSGGSKSIWSPLIADWRGYDRSEAYRLNYGGGGGFGSISSSFYLLIKYGRAHPRIFVCPSDVGTTEFRLADEDLDGGELSDIWDFGQIPSSHCSYAYHFPFGPHFLSASSRPDMPLAADRNPWIDSPMAGAKHFRKFDPDGTREAIEVGNSVCHQNAGQNVLHVDGRVAFEDRSFCGVNKDNIYTPQDEGDIRRGSPPTLMSVPSQKLDSLLVHDTVAYPQPMTPPPKGRACFVAATFIWIDGGPIQISEVSPGQTLGNYPGTVASSDREYVEQVQEHEGTFECRDILLETGNRISVVNSHCFMLDSGWWAAAQHLTGGMRLRTLSGSVTIESVRTRDVPYTGKVYNLKVKNSDMYLVGEDGVIVRDY